MAGFNKHGKEPSGSDEIYRSAEQLPISQEKPCTVAFFDMAPLNKPRTNPEVPGSLTLQVRSQASTGRNGCRTDVGPESLPAAGADPLACG
jgi:hypothetical protein